jgi:hypothetical protein
MTALMGMGILDDRRVLAEKRSTAFTRCPALLFTFQTMKI